MAWMTAEAAVAITAGVLASSVALTGFGLETRAVRIIGITFFALAAYLTAEAIRELAVRARPDHSLPGLAVTAAALVVMPVLAAAKRRTGHSLGSRILTADATETPVPPWPSPPSPLRKDSKPGKPKRMTTAAGGSYRADRHRSRLSRPRTPEPKRAKDRVHIGGCCRRDLRPGNFGRRIVMATRQAASSAEDLASEQAWPGLAWPGLDGDDGQAWPEAAQPGQPMMWGHRAGIRAA